MKPELKKSKANPSSRSSTLYARVADDIRLRIGQGELQPGQQLPPFPELCRHYGVSNITIRGALRSLSQDGLIVGEQRKGVFIAQPNKKKTGVLGCYGIDLSIQHLSYYLHLFSGVQRGAREAGYEILLLDPHQPSISWEKIEGLIFYGSEKDELLEKLPPGMCYSAILHEHSHAACVYADDYVGMAEAVEYLVQMGHRKIAYMYGPDDLTPARMRGYQDTLRRLGIEASPDWLVEMVHYHPQEYRGRGRVTAKAWLENGWRKSGCTALLCQNDRAAMGAMETLREMDIDVPGELSLVGFDSTDECELVTPRLTSVRVPLEEMGKAAVKNLVRLMNSDTPAKIVKEMHVALPTRLEVRNSVAKIDD